ncbi:hypothetical protein GGI13_002205 [Coemansia sp. RSA 455]|nr:hypothetical protein GGI13_002205 [Coemansia sp. RSA 455]
MSAPIPTCPVARQASADVSVGWWGNGDFKRSKVLDALYQLQDLVTNDCNRKTYYVYGDGVIVGAWFGKWVHPQSAYSLVSAYINDVSQYGVTGGKKAAEYCSTEADKAGYMHGITVDTNSNIAGVKQTVDSWSKGDCVTQWADGRVTWPKQNLQFYLDIAKVDTTESITPTPYNGKAAMYEIKSGDTCDSVQKDLSLNNTLDVYNKGVYGWFGCDAIVPGLTVSVSTGIKHAASGNNIFDQVTWMQDYESAFSPHLQYIGFALSMMKEKLMSEPKLTNFTVNVDSVTAGLWSGLWIDNKASVDTLDHFTETIMRRFGDAKLLQNTNGNDPRFIFGVIVSTNPDQVQEAMHAWQEGRRYSKGSQRVDPIVGSLHILRRSKINDVVNVEVEINPSEYTRKFFMNYVFNRNSTNDKFYATIAAGRYGVPSEQYYVAKYNTPIAMDKAVYGPVDNEVMQYIQMKQWVFEQGDEEEDRPGFNVTEIEDMINLTTDADISTCTMPIYIVNAGSQSSGRNFNRFVNALPSEPELTSNEANRHLSLDWSRCNPMDSKSPLRDGPLAVGQKYMVLVEYPIEGFNNCTKYTRAE